MNTRVYSIEWSGLGGRVSSWLDTTANTCFRSTLIWLPVAMIAGFGAWMLLAGYGSKPAESEPMATVAPEPAPSPAADTALGGSRSNLTTTALGEAITPVATAPVDGLRISSQSWRRGGLGSNALVTFTLRNRNDYAIKDVEISCAFSRRDGSHLTDRTRLIQDTVNRKSRKTFARLHVGFVNINAQRSKCRLIAASPA
jgi:hypothetical protein